MRIVFTILFLFGVCQAQTMQINKTSAPKTIQLNGVYIDVKGKVYNGSITLSPYSSAILIYKGKLTALPVTLLYFNSTVTGNQLALDWATGEEINNNHFEVQQSDDGITWRTVAVIPAKGNNSVYQYKTVLK